MGFQEALNKIVSTSHSNTKWIAECYGEEVRVCVLELNVFNTLCLRARRGCVHFAGEGENGGGGGVCVCWREGEGKGKGAVIKGKIEQRNANGIQ